MARLNVILLGGFQARLPSGEPVRLPTKKAQALLAFLALRPGQPHVRDKLAALLWGDTGEKQARHSLRQTLLALRKALPAAKPPSLLIKGETLALSAAVVDVDVATFARLVAEGSPKALEQAAALYQGDLLEGLGLKEEAFEEWLMTERERLRELALEAFAKLLAHQSQVGATEGAIQTALKLLALDPLQEVVHRALMRLYIRQGRRGAALRQYQLCVRVLQRELGAEPEAETMQLYQEILQREPSPSTATDPLRIRPAPRPRRRPLRSRPAALIPETPLVGRKPEVERLRQALDEAWRGRGQIVTVLGEAGIGKSRLVDELAVEGLQRAGRVLVGRSYETEQILPFGPWVDALRTGQVLHERDALQDLPSVWQAELARLFPEVGEPGLLFSAAPEDYVRLFEAMARLVEHLASRQPLLLILEDLHWADEMSLRLLSFLARRVHRWPVLMVGTAREEEVASAPILPQVLQELHREPRFAALTLSPLSRSDTMALVQALARPGAESQVAVLGDQIWAVSEGNPFMVVETMRALQEGTMPEGSRRLPLPQRVREIIAGRLERLGQRSRHLAAVAAVIGREFDFALLERAAGLDGPEAAEGMEELVRRRILHEVGEHFDFTHDRIREVAYSQLLPPRRKLLHGLVAKALEEVYPENLEPYYLALGVHYRAAEVWAKALTYFRQAGAGAVARSAYREAVTCFEEALVALRHLPESSAAIEQAIDLRFDLRNSLIPLGDHAQILAHLREAETLAETLDDHHRLAWVFAYLTEYFWLVGDHDRALESGRRALAITEAPGAFAPQMVANFYLGVVYYVLGDNRRAIDLLGRNIAVPQSGPIRERFGMHGIPSVLSQSWAVMALAELGEFAEGIARGEEAARIAEAVDHPFSLAVTQEGVGFLYLRKGDLHKAIPVLERGLGTCQIRHIPLLSPLLAAELGYAYALSGRVAEALPPLEQAVEQTASRQLTARHALFVAWLSEAYMLAGRMDEATELAGHALELSRDRKQRGYRAWALRLLGEIASRQNPLDIEEAQVHYRQALVLANEHSMRPLQAHCHLGLGSLYGKTGRPEQARSDLSVALGLFRSMEMTFWTLRAEAELAKFEPAKEWWRLPVVDPFGNPGENRDRG